MSDLDWLRELQERLWPPEQAAKGRAGNVQIKLEAKRELSKDEWQRVCKAIVENKLVVEMIGTNMFGGVGIRLFEHPPCFGVDEAELILTITQEHLPGPSRYDHLRGEVAEPEKHVPGSCLRRAWETFSEFSHTEQNKRWLKQYGLRESRGAESYDY